MSERAIADAKALLEAAGWTVTRPAGHATEPPAGTPVGARAWLVFRDHRDGPVVSKAGAVRTNGGWRFVDDPEATDMDDAFLSGDGWEFCVLPACVVQGDVQ